MARNSPLPYSGHRLDRQRRIGEPWSELPTRDEVHADDLTSDVVRYAYNDLGFRGPSFRSDARWTAFVFGESDGFGAEVHFEQAWAVRVAHEVARRCGIDERDVCVASFADEGASNAHIARMVMTQCGRVRPDLVLVNFAEGRRSEGFSCGDVFTAGPWLATDEVQAMLDAAPDEDDLKVRLTARLERGRAFLRYCTKPQGLLDAVHEMLLVQNALAAWSIDAVAIARNTKRLFNKQTRRDPVIGPLVEQLDPGFLARFRPTKLRWRNDWSSDGQHYGPRTHAAIARRVVAHLEQYSPDVFGPPSGPRDGTPEPAAPLPRRSGAATSESPRTSAAMLRSRHV